MVTASHVLIGEHTGAASAYVGMTHGGADHRHRAARQQHPGSRGPGDPLAAVRMVVHSLLKGGDCSNFAQRRCHAPPGGCRRAVHSTGWQLVGFPHGRGYEQVKLDSVETAVID
jgi:hypothetical protein